MIWIAFILGLGGSLHCAAMCGPLVFSVQKSYGLSGAQWGVWLYHAGRLVAYILLAMLFGLLHVPAQLFGAQQYIAILSGLLLLAWVWRDKISPVRYIINQISTKLTGAMQGSLKYKSSLPVLGFLNGLLPCGLSYAAAALSLNYVGIIQAMWFMLLFGLGTFPMFFAASLFGSSLTTRFKIPVSKYMKYALIATAFILMIRGAGLGIPYLSPSFNAQTTELSCCEVPKK